MTKYTVVIHYEGSVDYTIEAENEEDAKEIASQKMMNEDLETICEGIDWDICDVWEEEDA